jgi:hypothetical protein
MYEHSATAPHLQPSNTIIHRRTSDLDSDDVTHFQPGVRPVNSIEDIVAGLERECNLGKDSTIGGKNSELSNVSITYYITFLDQTAPQHEIIHDNVRQTCIPYIRLKLREQRHRTPRWLTSPQTRHLVDLNGDQTKQFSESPSRRFAKGVNQSADVTIRSIDVLLDHKAEHHVYLLHHHDSTTNLDAIQKTNDQFHSP